MLNLLLACCLHVCVRAAAALHLLALAGPSGKRMLTQALTYADACVDLWHAASTRVRARCSSFTAAGPAGMLPLDA
jgi:hypothetical protein